LCGSRSTYFDDVAVSVIEPYNLERNLQYEDIDMEKCLLKFDRKPDFIGVGRFFADGEVLDDYLCCFFLPTREVAKMWVLIRAPIPTENLVALHWRFSCELTVGSSVLFAEEIFSSGYTEWDWQQNGLETTLVGEITRLKINRDAPGASVVSKVTFSVTPSALLRSADVVIDRDGKVVSQRVVREGPVCSAEPGSTFRFYSVYRPNVSGKPDFGVECELVESAHMHDFSRVVLLLRDVLVAASLAERRIVFLTGWTISYANGASSSFYRRDFTAPPEEEVDIDETLISLRDIEEFLNQSIGSFGTSPHSGALKQAIYFALYGQAPGIGESFVMLFAGIETLLNAFEPVHNVAPPVSKPTWQTLADKITATLESAPAFLALDKDTKTRVLGAVKGSNQVSFGDRFKKMCTSQNIDLSDLWPMLGGKSSLYSVRNRIVHGRLFASDQEWFRVISAKSHLRWTLERSILSILGWPIDRSRSSSKSLCGLTLYGNWRSDEAYFASTP
jgi:hypothetical protein